MWFIWGLSLSPASADWDHSVYGVYGISLSTQVILSLCVSALIWHYISDILGQISVVLEFRIAQSSDAFFMRGTTFQCTHKHT